MNSPPMPIANSATSNNTWNVLAWAILCLRVSCTSSTTGLVLQNLNNLLSSAQEELKQNTVMPSEWRLNNWSQHGRYNSSFEIPLKNYDTSYAAHGVLNAEVMKAEVKRAKLRRLLISWEAGEQVLSPASGHWAEHFFTGWSRWAAASSASELRWKMKKWSSLFRSEAGLFLWDFVS
jgi:hypothetical protein